MTLFDTWLENRRKTIISEMTDSVSKVLLTITAPEPTSHTISLAADGHRAAYRRLIDQLSVIEDAQSKYEMENRTAPSDKFALRRMALMAMEKILSVEWKEGDPISPYNQIWRDIHNVVLGIMVDDVS